MSDKEDLIRDRAHAIWEREGRPEGAGDRHWEQARAEIAAEADPIGTTDTLEDTALTSALATQDDPGADSVLADAGPLAANGGKKKRVLGGRVKNPLTP